MADLKNIELTQEQQQVVFLILLVLGGGGWAYWKYFWAPTSQKIVEARAQIEDLERKVINERNKANKVPALKKKRDELQARAEAQENKLPREARIPDTLYALTETASRYQIEMNSIGPGSASAKQYVIERPYALQVEARYHTLAQFLAEFGLAERIYTTRGLSLQGIGDQAGGPSEGGVRQTIRASFELVTYQYKG